MPQPGTVLFLNQPVFQENKIYNFKIHLISFLNTKQTNDGIFFNKAGKILIWQKWSRTWEPDFKEIFCWFIFCKSEKFNEIEKCWKLSECSNILFLRELLVVLYLEPFYFIHSNNSFALSIKSLRHRVERAILRNTPLIPA